MSTPYATATASASSSTRAGGLAGGPVRGVHGRGFTLLELLVVLALAGLMAVGMGSALLAAVQTGERIDARLQRQEDLRSTLQLLRNLLEGTTARLISAADLPPGQTYRGLRAGPDWIEWVAPMPARPGVGGLQVFRLTIEPQDDQTQAIVLRYQPLLTEAEREAGSPMVGDWAQAQARVLVADARRLAVQTRAEWAAEVATDPQALQWRPGWGPAPRLPTEVWIEIADGRGDWPALMVLPRGVGRGGSGFVVAGQEEE